ITALRRQLERERAARREAEALLESKSLELFHVNRDLERRVAERVSELETAKTALHEAVDRAESANRVKSEFLARMSHEVRTPMTAILGYADILLRSGGLEAGSRRAVVAVRRNADHLLALLNDVLDLSKIEAGQMALQTERCRLLPIIAELESMMVMRAVERGLAFRVVYDTAVPKYLRTDRVRFQQILANLLGNAIKFTDAGTVTLRFRLDDSGPLIVTVEDTGIGIDPAHLETIFQPFTHGPRGAERGGTGLGLDISRRLAEMLGGRITVRSHHGRGTVFTLSLDPGETPVLIDPSREPAEAGDREDLLSELVKQSLQGRRILVVDDNPDNQRIIAYILEQAGARAELAENGEIGVRAVLEGETAGAPYDLIVMDMDMPVKDGYTATAELRAAGVETPIVALTAHAMTGDKERCLRAGCNDYVSKPVDSEFLIETIRQHLAPPESAATEVREDGSSAASFASHPAFAALRVEYVASFRDLIERIRAACTDGRTEEARCAAHKIKGTAANYGYPAITEAAARAEQHLAAGRRPLTGSGPVEELLVMLEAAADEADIPAVDP
ncbi:MAG: ATP-binding protein, partial [Planctomycetota bacterium]